MYHKHGGHLDNPEKTLYSFTHGDKNQWVPWGIDTTTPEGRAEFEAEWDRLCQMAPELFNKDEMIYPHEMRKPVPTEPHFRRMWQFYR